MTHPLPGTTLLPTRTIRLGPLRLTLAGGSCVGNRYPRNFDVLHVDGELPFLAVADGMGGGAGSAAAGRIAMEVLVAGVRRVFAGPAPAGGGAATLRAVVAKAQRRVIATGAELGELTGCTLTGLIAAGSGAGGPGLAGDGDGAWIVQLGDSRAYRRRAGLLELLTVDHTMAWLGAVNGWYAADSPAARSARYQLTRYLGHPDAPEPDLLSVSLRPGDVYCLCTDGVAEQVDFARLDGWLASPTPLDEIVTGVLADSLDAGGHDNATVAVLRVESG